MQRLSKLDKVAYVRFASVYRRFRDIESFERELSKLKKSSKKTGVKKPKKITAKTK